jgi:hypothetical protein
VLRVSRLGVWLVAADLDPGDAAALAAQLQTEDTFEFVVDVAYTDVEGEQTTRTGIAVEGRRDYWSVTHVALYRGHDVDPYVELRRRAEADSVA